jgi:hypothetical protein
VHALLAKGALEAVPLLLLALQNAGTHGSDVVVLAPGLRRVLTQRGPTMSHGSLIPVFRYIWTKHAIEKRKGERGEMGILRKVMDNKQACWGGR